VGVSPWEFKSPPRHQSDLFKFEEVVKFNLGGSSSAVECFLAKEEVASSNLVFRSSRGITLVGGSRCGIQFGGVAKRLRQGSAKPLYSGSNPLAASSIFTASCQRWWEELGAEVAER
jgi:hypothetical protein